MIAGVPVSLIEVAHHHATRRRCVHKLIFFQVDTHMRNAAVAACVEENEITLTQVITVNGLAVALVDACRVTFNFFVVHGAIHFHHHARAVGSRAALTCSVLVRRAEPSLQLFVELLVVAVAQMDGERGPFLAHPMAGAAAMRAMVFGAIFVARVARHGVFVPVC